MNDQVKITFPEKITGGQSSCALYQDRPIWSNPADGRTYYQKFIYRLLMWIHGHAESLWHWAYYTSLKYQAPQSKIIGSDPIYLGTWGKNGERLEDTAFGDAKVN